MIRAFSALFVAYFTLVAVNPATAQETLTFKFGTLAPDNTPWSRLLQEFKQKLEERSGGRAKMKIFLNGVMGDERAMLQAMRIRKLNGGGFSTGGISTVVPELQIFELPFLFHNNEEADYIMDHVLRDDMARALETKDLYLLMWAENGWLDFGNKRHAIRSPTDMKDVIWFNQESEVMFAFWRSLGVNAVPLTIPEVLSSLQRDVVTGYHNTPVFATGAQWFTQTKYWTVSHHIYQPAAVVIDLSFWKKLSPADQQIVTEIAAELQPRVRSEVRGLDKDLLDGFKKAGIQINYLSDAERAAFEKATAHVGEEMVKKGAFPQAMLDKTRMALAEYRKKAKK